MKNSLLKLLAFLLTLGSVTPADAQQPDAHVQFSAGIGAGSSDQLFDGYEFGFILAPSFKTYIVKHYSGTACFSVKFFVSERIVLGISGAYENESGDWQKNVNIGGAYDWQTIQLGTFKRQAFTCAPEISIFYTHNDLSMLYTTGGIGVTYQNEIDAYSTTYYLSQYYNGHNSLGSETQFYHNKVHINSYYSPIGIRYGGRLSVFAEVGIGYKGIINGGLLLKI